MGTSGSVSMQARDLEALEMRVKKKALEDRLAGRSEPTGGGSSAGGSSGRMSGGGGQDQASRDKELAMQLAEKARSEKAGSENRINEDKARADLAEEARAKAAARALALAATVK